MKLKDLAALILSEDCSDHDVSTKALGELGQVLSCFRIVAREKGCFSGVSWLETMSEIVPFKIQTIFEEGQKVEVGDVVLELEAPTNAVLAVERSLLNVLQQLCGVATLTASYVARIRSKALPFGLPSPQLLHTRKTLPLLRDLQIQAVLAGGGALHRRSLEERMLFKDNHKFFIERSGLSFPNFLKQHLSAQELAMALVEVDSLEEALEMEKVGVKNLMLDNFTPQQVEQCLAKFQSPMTVEVSGGIHLDNVASYVLKGVQRISVGGLTHSVKAFDFSMEVVT